jgi:aldose 1-epimerase
MAMTGEWFEIRAGDYRAQLSEVGAGLAGLWHSDRPLTSPWPDGVLPPMSGGAVLIPWPNRIRDGRYHFGGSDYQLPLSEPAQHNASHGLVRWVRFTVADRSDDSVTFAHHLVPQTGYPFELVIGIRYELTADGGLSVTTTVDNHAGTSAPFGAGFHPYLDLDGHDLDRAEIEVPAATRLVTDDRQIPIERVAVAGTPYQLSPRRALGTLRVDHGFTDLTGTTATVAVGGHATELWWDSEFEYLQVFTPPLERFGRTAIAIEPMTCAPDAFNSGDGLIELGAGETFRASWGITAAG